LKSIQEENYQMKEVLSGSLQWVCDDRIKDDLVSLDRIEAEFGRTYSDYLHKQAQNS
jgi:hypothetical protein